jgi:iron complex outermembrane receptor protein
VQFISNKETPFSDTLQWVGGIYYIHASGGFDPLKFTVAPNFLNTLAFQNPNLPLGVLSTLGDGIGVLLSSLGLNPNVDAAALNSYGISDAHSWAGYFQGTYYFTDWLNMTAGARYQKERRDLVDGHLKVVLPNGDEVTERTDSPPTLHATQVSPKVNVQIKPTEDSQVYLSWSRAYKSPTYNTVNFFSTPKAVKEEKVDSYEIGYKGDPFDNLRINGAVFLINQKDLLTGFVALASGGVVEYDNAGDARIKGAEGDVTWSPLPTFDPGLALTGAFTYLHAYYTSYPDGRGFDEATGLAFGQGSLTGLPARDFTGNTIVRTPKWSYSLAANQRWEFGPGGIEVGADMYFSSRFYFLPQDAKIYSREAYHTYNARLTYFLKEPSVEFTAFVQNIGDVEYNEVVFTADFGRNEVLNAPRLYGFRVSMKF